jgi:Ca2+-binding RTX toxin-like protein
MAVFQAGNVGGIDLSAFDLAALTTGTPTKTDTSYRFPGIEFQGFGFIYTGDDLTGGTITTIIVFSGLPEVYRISGLLLPVADVDEFLLADDSQGLLAAIFNQPDTFIGSTANDHLLGFAGIDKLQGGNGNDTLDGGSDNDVVNGEAGNDSLLGGTGDDQLTGGAGEDTMDGGDGSDTYDFDNIKDLVNDTGLGVGDIDTIRSSMSYQLEDVIENLVLTGSATIGYGNASNNVLTGNNEANILDGKAGADTMRGSAGHDTYFVDDKNDVADETTVGSGGIDTVFSSASEFQLGVGVDRLTLTGTADINGTGNNDLSNVITGNAGKNLLSGLDQHDTLIGGAGDDTLDGGAGKDSMAGGLGSDTYVVDNLGDVIVEVSESGSTDTVRSSISYKLGDLLNNLELLGNFDLSGTGNIQSNHIIGNSGDNILSGDDNYDAAAVGSDTLEGGEGDDTYIVWYSSDQVKETGVDDYDIVKSVATFTLGANLEELVLFRKDHIPVDGTGNELDNKITGSEQDNKLSGAGGNDSINGGIGVGKDTLDGGVGDDTMVGAAGDDVYFVDSLKDVVIDSSGADEVRLMGADPGLVKLYTGIEHYNFSDFDAGPLTFTGTTAANRITGTTEADTLVGGSGNDTLNGGAGEDSLDGGAGNDTYVVAVDKDVINDTGKDAGDTVQTATLQIDLTLKDFTGVENVTFTGAAHLSATGTAAKNILTGNAGDNILLGGLGNDTLIGGGGADVLEGGLGADSMAGGTGSDSYGVDSTGDKVVENADSGIADVVSSTVSYVLGNNVENLVLVGSGDLNGKGNTLGNVIVGTDGKNRIDGWFGIDKMQGLDGNDTYVVIEEEDQVVEDIGKGTDLVEAWVDIAQLYDNVENLVLKGIAGFEANGNKLANMITGNQAGNKIDGKEGDDTMIGAAGDDIYTMDSLLDKIEEKAGGGGDEIIFDLDSKDPSLFQIRTNIEHYNFSKYEGDAVNFTGDKAANRITGSSKSDTLAGGAGNDTLDGFFGADSLTGGAGNDSYVLDNVGDVFTEKDANGKDTGGKDTIVSLFADYTLGAPSDNIENLTIGGFNPGNGTGNIAANVLTGNDAENILSGAEGNDTIIGNLGDDTLDGGLGNDSMVGGGGSDRYILDSKSDRVVESIFSPNTGDTIVANFTYVLARGLENLVLTGTANLNGTGNVDTNELTGNDGDNKLDGVANIFGADFLSGGKGNDTYYVHVIKGTSVIGDLVTEEEDEGTDTVIVDAKAKFYSLADDVENLTLTGSLASKGVGNDRENVLTGNSGANTLQGEAGDDSLNGSTGNDSLLGGFGDDTLSGGTGTDTLNGDLGNDTYVIDNAKDKIEDKGLEAETDTIQATISIDLNLDNFKDAEAVRLTGAGALSATGDIGDNLLVGSTGANKLTGNDGDDTIQGDRGNDTIDGGAGNDVFLYTSKLDGRDVINGFDGDAAGGGQDVLDLDALFDSLNVDTDLRDDRIALNDKGSSVEVRVDVDGKDTNGAEVLVATLNTADQIDVGADILVGTLS